MIREELMAMVGRHASTSIELETVGCTISHNFCGSVSVLIGALAWPRCLRHAGKNANSKNVSRYRDRYVHMYEAHRTSLWIGSEPVSPQWKLGENLMAECVM